MRRPSNFGKTIIAYGIERLADDVTFKQVGIVGPSTRTYNDSGLGDGQRYYYRARPGWAALFRRHRTWSAESPAPA